MENSFHAARRSIGAAQINLILFSVLRQGSPPRLPPVKPHQPIFLFSKNPFKNNNLKIRKLSFSLINHPIHHDRYRPRISMEFLVLLSYKTERRIITGLRRYPCLRRVALAEELNG
ncbi:hypothetical protein R5R73_02665 [Salinicola sp. LHM]|uniref:hypothetical protein n=1 Tax=Salinicola sp. LHM TaxID=3065298 RepID=UPI002ACDF092|nr:hypothetical protein [Salinicola sp. LHM]WQH33599.1 hypothetical protein R5R73_02665 [Salinicola sp. LHM]